MASHDRDSFGPEPREGDETCLLDAAAGPFSSSTGESGVGCEDLLLDLKQKKQSFGLDNLEIYPLIVTLHITATPMACPT